MPVSVPTLNFDVTPFYLPSGRGGVAHERLSVLGDHLDAMGMGWYVDNKGHMPRPEDLQQPRGYIKTLSVTFPHSPKIVSLGAAQQYARVKSLMDGLHCEVDVNAYRGAFLHRGLRSGNSFVEEARSPTERDVKLTLSTVRGHRMLGIGPTAISEHDLAKLADAISMVVPGLAYSPSYLDWRMQYDRSYEAGGNFKIARHLRGSAPAPE